MEITLKPMEKVMPILFILVILYGLTMFIYYQGLNEGIKQQKTCTEQCILNNMTDPIYASYNKMIGCYCKNNEFATKYRLIS